MNIKSILISGILSIMLIGLFTLDYIKLTDINSSTADTIYKIYLQGNELGYIEDDEKLYALINNEQQEIKDKYSVDSVYPPSDFEIIKVNTYNDNLTEVETIYQDIEEYDNFTVKGYTATIKSTDENVSDIVINVLDKEVFDEAINIFINAFIDAETYMNYLNDTQDEIVDYGEYINEMYFAENISIKENYISVKDEIFTDSNELTQYLLFGPDAVMNTYEVKSGDTIESISADNLLNPKEFLIANPNFRDSSTLLKLGEKVNVTLLNPLINFIYEISVTEEVEIDYITTTVVDNTKSVGYSEPTVAGVTGLQKVTKTYDVINGLASKEIEVSDQVVIREVVNAVTTVGPSYSGSSSLKDYVYTGFTFSLPTLPGAYVSSWFGEIRDGYIHRGTDFSGTGHGSPIFAIADGVVTQAKYGTGGQGNYVIISHGNGYFSNYLHMVSGSLLVEPGDVVKGGQQIGQMGNTGWSFGTHLHIEFTNGEPYTGQSVTYYDAYKIIYGG